MKRFLQSSILFCLSLLFLTGSGCIEIEDTYILNPDGSGKVKRRVILSPVQFNLTAHQPEHPEKLIKQIVKKEISNAKGIDAWKDISYHLRDDGRIFLSATAYFPDINKVDFHNNNMSSPFPNIRFKTSDEGRFTLQAGAETKEEESSSESQNELSGEALEKKIKIDQAKYRTLRGLLEPWGEIRINNTYRLPGQVETSSNFKQASQSTVRIQFSGEKILNMMDKMMNDRDLLRKDARKGKDIATPRMGLDSEIGQQFNKQLKRKVAKGSLGNPQFDYAKEVKQAKQSSVETLERLGIGGTRYSTSSAQKKKPSGESVEPETTEKVKLKDMKLTKLNMTFVKDQEADLYEDKGMELKFLGVFQGPILNIKEAKISDVTLQSGEKVISQSKDVSFPSLGDEGRKVTFSVTTALPSGQAFALKSISGSVTYTRQIKKNTVDVGIKEFKEGATGNKLGAKISSLETSDDKKDQKPQMSLQLDIARSQREKIVIYDAEGNKVTTSQNHTSSTSSKTWFHLDAKNGFPAKGRIEVTYHIPTQPYQVPFKITDFSLADSQ